SLHSTTFSCTEDDGDPYFWFLLSIGMLRVLAGSVDEIGKLFAGSLQERAPVGLLLCMALARAGCKHEEPRYLRRSAAECELFCCWLVPVATESVMARMTVEESRSLMPTKEARIRPVASLKPSSNLSVKVTTHMVSPPSLFSLYNDISLLLPHGRRLMWSQGHVPLWPCAMNIMA